VRSSVSIVLFFLLSGFFLAALVGATERNRKLLGVAGALMVVLVCIIVFVKPVQLPSLSQVLRGTSTTTTATPSDDSSTTPTTAAPAGTSPNTTAAPATTSTTLMPGTSSLNDLADRSSEVTVAG
jgi:hypothetical protein